MYVVYLDTLSAGIGIFVAMFLIIVISALSPPYFRDARMSFFVLLSLTFTSTGMPWRQRFFLKHLSLSDVLYIILFVILFNYFLRQKLLVQMHAGQRLCAICGYVLTNNNPCPECNGRYWFVMPKSMFGKWNENSNMPRLWVSGRELALMIGSTVVLLVLGAAASWAVPATISSWQIGGVEFGWVVPMGIWAGAVALAFVVAGAIRRRADRRRGIGSG